MKFNLNEYEPVKARKQRFYGDHPDGRIIVSMVNSEASIQNMALFKASIYMTAEDQEKGLPRATGYALELRDTELKATRDGRTYESVNFTSWTENAEESAVGRALDNAGYASNMKASREEMEKVERMSKTVGNLEAGLKKRGDYDKASKAIETANDIDTLDTLRAQIDEREWENGRREKLIALVDGKMAKLSEKLFAEEAK